MSDKDKENEQNEENIKKPSQSMYALSEKVYPIAIEDEMKNSYIDYAMSVIVGRALPDVRDGLKPVHRRILYAMSELGLAHNKPYKKSARIVGEVLGKYHPHGDTAVYDTLVRMVQDFSLRHPLVDGQGNFGSVDGDNAAAMRYTEARLASITEELLGDIDKDTVEFQPNFDESLQEPKLLPSKLPNLLVNGSAGIAVGMATSIPPHNLEEVVDGLIALIDEPNSTSQDLMKHVKGPDFPTGGMIMGKEGIKQAYATGRGKVQLRAKAHFEKANSGRAKDAIVIDEIPYQVNKSNLISNMAKLVESKKIEGIYDIRDESDRDGMRVVVELKKDENDELILNQLFKHTQMQDTVSIINLALVKGEPKILPLKDILQHFVDHRVEVIERRTRFELNKAEKRAHILEGLKIAISNLDKIIKLIRAAKSPEEAKQQLMKQFKLSEVQSKAILELQLQKLTALERHKIDEEYAELLKKIAELESILKSKTKVLSIIKEESLEVKKKYGNPRKTDIVKAAEDIDIEDLIKEEDVLITMSHAGYIKRIPVSSYRAQRRGGKGVTGGGVRDDDDFIEQMFLCSTHETMLFFTNRGRCYWKKAYQIPQASRIAKGKAVVNVLNLSKGEEIATMLQIKNFDEDQFLVQVTKEGLIKKTSLTAYSRPRSNGIQAIKLKNNDELMAAMITDGKNQIFIATKQGKAIRFEEKNVREMGRTASGVRGIRLSKGDHVISSDVVQDKQTALTVTSKGYGKKSSYGAYRVQTRGGKGVINIKATDKNGHVVKVMTVCEEDEIVLVTTKGQIVRSAVNQIRTSGRNAQGVRVIKLKDGHDLATCCRVVTREVVEEDQPDLL